MLSKIIPLCKEKVYVQKKDRGFIHNNETIEIIQMSIKRGMDKPIVEFYYMEYYSAKKN